MTAPSWLTPFLQELSELIGFEATLKLVETRGGGRVSIPSRPGPDHWLTHLLGSEAASILGQRYGGGTIILPLGPRRGITGMRRVCDEAIARGATISEAARLSGFTERAVSMRKAAGHAAKASRQLSLFDD